jgi:hypothetical protein
MRSVLVVLALVALVGAGAALSARGDPQKRITPADQARARAMLLRPADFNAAYTALPSRGSGGADFYCAALDESDLTLTGQAQSPSFVATGEYVTSTVSVYRSRADSNASWKRGTSAAGQACLREGVRSEIRGPATRLVSFARMAFPPRGDRSVAFRGVATQQGVRLYLDVVAIQVSRSQSAVIYITALAPPPQSELRRLTALVAKRAASAMRGG